MNLEGWSVLLSPQSLSYLLSGLGVTLQLILILSITSFLLGMLLATARAFGNGLVIALFDGYIALFRNFPALVVMLFLRFGLPLVGFSLGSAWTAAIVAMTLYNSAMIAEVLRGGIMSIAKGQTEAALATGCSRWFAFSRIVMPQALRRSVPALASQFIVLVQGTTLVTIIGVPDLLHNATVLYSRYGNPLETLILVGAVFTALCMIVAGIRSRIEARNTGNVRSAEEALL